MNINLNTIKNYFFKYPTFASNNVTKFSGFTTYTFLDYSKCWDHAVANFDLSITCPLFYLVVNLSVFALFFTFVFNIKWSTYFSILIVIFQLFYFYNLKWILKLNNYFPFGVSYEIPNLPFKPFVQYGFYFNDLNYNFVVITAVLTTLSLLYSLSIKIDQIVLIRVILIINIFAINLFLVDDMLMFFFFIECSVFPMVYLISFWGSRAERLKAGMTYLYFSLFASVLLFVGVCMVYAYLGSTKMDIIFLDQGFNNFSKLLEFRSTSASKIAFFLIFTGLAIKLPIFIFHIWLPEAHGEANTIGSVLLAGVYLKMAAYGIIAYVLPLFYFEMVFFKNFICLVCVLGVLFCSISILRGFDLKKFIAYTSVIHMNFILIGLITSSQITVFGAVYSLVAHSYITSTLFFLVGMLYERLHTRNIENFRSLFILDHMPVLIYIFFLFLLINASVPIGATFLGEIVILVGLITINPFMSFLLLVGLSIAAVAHYFLINKIIGRSDLVSAVVLNNRLKHKKLDIKPLEILILLTLFYFSFRIFFYPTFYLSPVEVDIETLINSFRLNLIDLYPESIKAHVHNLYASIISSNLDYSSPEMSKYITIKYKLLLSDQLNDPKSLYVFFRELQYIDVHTKAWEPDLFKFMFYRSHVLFLDENLLSATEPVALYVENIFTGEIELAEFDKRMEYLANATKDLAKSIKRPYNDLL